MTFSCSGKCSGAPHHQIATITSLNFTHITNSTTNNILDAAPFNKMPAAVEQEGGLLHIERLHRGGREGVGADWSFLRRQGPAGDQISATTRCLIFKDVFF